MCPLTTAWHRVLLSVLRCAFKDSAVKQVTKVLSGPVDTWYPPAGLYCENSSKGCAQNMWHFLPPERRTLPDKDYDWGEEGAPRGKPGAKGGSRELGAPHPCLTA